MEAETNSGFPTSKSKGPTASVIPSRFFLECTAAAARVHSHHTPPSGYPHPPRPRTCSRAAAHRTDPHRDRGDKQPPVTCLGSFSFRTSTPDLAGSSRGTGASHPSQPLEEVLLSCESPHGQNLPEPEPTCHPAPGWPRPPQASEASWSYPAPGQHCRRASSPRKRGDTSLQDPHGAFIASAEPACTGECPAHHREQSPHSCAQAHC